MSVIWVLPVLTMVGAAWAVLAIVRRVEREVAATSVAVTDAVESLGGLHRELDRAQAHLARLEGQRRPR